MGLLAVAEMGGDLSRVAHIAAPGPDPLEVAAVLLDGVPMIVFDAPGGASPSRMRALLARVRSHGAVLIVTSTNWTRPDLEIPRFRRPLLFDTFYRHMLGSVDLGCDSRRYVAVFSR
ncbi:hypothetical protein ACWEQA_23880 [Nocardia sp. NPDC004085]